MNKSKHAYLIIAHKNIEQINNLISLLDNPRVDIYVHIDANCDIEINQIIKDTIYSKVFVFKVIPVFWADYSMVEVELFLLNRATENGVYLYYHLLSGMDLPLMGQNKILRFFDANQGNEFVDAEIEGENLLYAYKSRIKYYHFFTKKYRSSKFSSNVASKILFLFEYFLIGIQIIFRVNRIPDNYLVAKGSQWFSITDKFARFILEKTDYIYKQFHNTFAPDEYFIAMIAINSEFRSNLYRKDCDGDMHANMRYIDWIRGNPYVFRETDWDLLINSGLCFARKFDSNVDNNIIEKISGWVKNDQ